MRICKGKLLNIAFSLFTVGLILIAGGCGVSVAGSVLVASDAVQLAQTKIPEVKRSATSEARRQQRAMESFDINCMQRSYQRSTRTIWRLSSGGVSPKKDSRLVMTASRRRSGRVSVQPQRLRGALSYHGQGRGSPPEEYMILLVMAACSDVGNMEERTDTTIMFATISLALPWRQ